MAAVSLSWDTNMAAVTSCENTLFVVVNNVGATVIIQHWIFFLQPRSQSSLLPVPTEPREFETSKRENLGTRFFFFVCQSVTINVRKPHMSFVGQTVKRNFLTGSKKQYI